MPNISDTYHHTSIQNANGFVEFNYDKLCSCGHTYEYHLNATQLSNNCRQYICNNSIKFDKTFEVTYLPAFYHNLKICYEYLTDADFLYAINYFEHGLKLFNTGVFYNQHKTAWSKYNFRYSERSVRGTSAELIAIALINKNIHHNWTYLGSHTKSTEMNGQDIIFTNPSWSHIYFGQVKLQENNLWIYPQANWFTERYKTHVHRLVLVDINRPSCIVVDYPAFCSRYDIHPIKITTLAGDKKIFPRLYTLE